MPTSGRTEEIKAKDKLANNHLFFAVNFNIEKSAGTMKMLMRNTIAIITLRLCNNYSKYRLPDQLITLLANYKPRLTYKKMQSINSYVDVI